MGDKERGPDESMWKFLQFNFSERVDIIILIFMSDCIRRSDTIRQNIYFPIENVHLFKFEKFKWFPVEEITYSNLTEGKWQTI